MLASSLQERPLRTGLHMRHLARTFACKGLRPFIRPVQKDLSSMAWAANEAQGKYQLKTYIKFPGCHCDRSIRTPSSCAFGSLPSSLSGILQGLGLAEELLPTADYLPDAKGPSRVPSTAGTRKASQNKDPPQRPCSDLEHASCSKVECCNSLNGNPLQWTVPSAVG